MPLASPRPALSKPSGHSGDCWRCVLFCPSNFQHILQPTLHIPREELLSNLVFAAPSGLATFRPLCRCGACQHFCLALLFLLLVLCVCSRNTKSNKTSRTPTPNPGTPVPFRPPPHAHTLAQKHTHWYPHPGPGTPALPPPSPDLRAHGVFSVCFVQPGEAFRYITGCFLLPTRHKHKHTIAAVLHERKAPRHPWVCRAPRAINLPTALAPACADFVFCFLCCCLLVFRRTKQKMTVATTYLEASAPRRPWVVRDLPAFLAPASIACVVSTTRRQAFHALSTID